MPRSSIHELKRIEQIDDGAGEMNRILPLITNIQRFSLHDGPGIRTTVFTKGCSLRCPWCSNPENQKPYEEKYMKDGDKGVYGSYSSCGEIYDEVVKDRIFYGEWNCDKYKRSIFPEASEIEMESFPGGVTFTGGEALLQADRLEPLFGRLRKEKIHMAVETCLFVPIRKLEIAFKYIDLFYVDIKILDADVCESVLSGKLNLYLDNLAALFAERMTVVFRIPVIGGYTDGRDNRNRILGLLRKYRPKKVEIIKEHSLGSEKYQTLSLAVPDYKGVRDELLEDYGREIAELGLEVEVCRV